MEGAGDTGHAVDSKFSLSERAERKQEGETEGAVGGRRRLRGSGEQRAWRVLGERLRELHLLSFYGVSFGARVSSTSRSSRETLWSLVPSSEFPRSLLVRTPSSELSAELLAPS